MKRMRYVDPTGGFIDYRLSLLGIRATAHDCQLIARNTVGGEWEPMGPKRALPIEVPADAASLESASSDPLRLTAWQYDVERPGSDIREVLSRRREFRAAVGKASAK